LAAIYFPADGGEDGDWRNKHWSGTDPDGDAQSYGNEAEVPVAIKDVIRNSTHCCGAFFSTFSRAGKRIRPKGTKVFGEGCIG
jgi:hypothetical protein